MGIFSNFQFFLKNKEEIRFTRFFENEDEKYELIKQIDDDIEKGSVIIIHAKASDNFTLHIPSSSINYYRHEKSRY